MRRNLYKTFGIFLAITILTFKHILSDECFYEGQAYYYSGTVSTTRTDRTCQRWDVTSPHHPNYPMTSEHGNFCRSPDSDIVPWCYTMDPFKRWEYCAVPLCSNAIVTTTHSSTGNTFTIRLLTEETKLSIDASTEVHVPAQLSSELATVNPNQNTVHLCMCACNYRNEFWMAFLNSNMTDTEKENLIEMEKKRLRDLLAIDKKTLKSYIRGQTSASDDRSSSFTIGVLGISIMSSLCGFIVFLDLTSIFRRSSW